MNRTIRTLLAVSIGVAFPACDGSGTSTTSAATESSALVTAQCTFKSFRASVDTCFTTFNDCVAAETTETDCKAALTACLPAAPSQAATDGGHDCRGMSGGGAGGRGHGGGEPHGGNQNPRVVPDSAAITACHDAATACLTAGTAEESCRQTEHDCVHAAFKAAFDEQCATAQAACGDTCTEIDARCSAGVEGAADGGTSCN